MLGLVSPGDGEPFLYIMYEVAKDLRGDGVRVTTEENPEYQWYVPGRIY